MTSVVPPAATRPGPAQFVLFGAGDFACNLYWQSVSLYLLFFYTEALALPAALAGTIYMIGALWDGIADLLIGMAAQRFRGRYRRFVAFGAAPLGLAFAGVYLAPPLTGAALAIAVLAAQIVFRTLYALVNVPYVAWSARFSPESRDRTVLAAVRMLFGTAAALLVVTGTPWIVQTLTGDAARPAGYLYAATAFALLGVPLLLAVARYAREPQVGETPVERASLATCLRVLARNRAFVTLNLAATASGLAAALLTQSVLYFFKYVARDAAGGPRALSAMAVAAALAVPLWVVVSRRIGLRATWLVAAALGLAALGLFGAVPGGAVLPLLIAAQIAFSGFNLVFWSMLPNTVEYGEALHGTRVEALTFGVAALLQKAGLAAAAGLLGLFYGRIGYAPRAIQSPVAVAGIRDLMLYACSGGLAVSVLLMLASPLRRGVHAALVEDLTARDAA